MTAKKSKIMKLDSTQKEWLLETFFKNEEFAGWRGIAEKLIDTGKCVTTNQGGAIWVGGVGNFIQCEPYGGGVDLVELSFDVKEFTSMNNRYFFEYYQAAVNTAVQKKEEAEQYFLSIGKICST